jgi:hypothetical protein
LTSEELESLYITGILGAKAMAVAVVRATVPADDD